MLISDKMVFYYSSRERAPYMGPEGPPWALFKNEGGPSFILRLLFVGVSVLQGPRRGPLLFFRGPFIIESTPLFFRVPFIC